MKTLLKNSLRRNRGSRLLVVGLLLAVSGVLYSNVGSVSAVSRNVNVGATIPGPPPSVGATITSPLNNSTSSTAIITVEGTCAPSTIVVISRNDQTAGSTVCDGAGTFSLSIQLQPEKNVLKAMNYDQLNQAGPATPAVTVTYIPPPNSTASPSTDEKNPITTVSGSSPSEPTASTGAPIPFCDDNKGSEAPKGPLGLIASCALRQLKVDQTFHLRVMVYGGTAPYALMIDWGDGSQHTLISASAPGYQSIAHTYTSPGKYNIKIRATDQTGAIAFMQIVVEVDGTPSSVLKTLKNVVMNTSWLESPVPFYLVSFGMAIGFWVGYLFHAHFGGSGERRWFFGRKR
jgi:hypothetical protein